jgi:hypothetical protein
MGKGSFRDVGPGPNVTFSGASTTPLALVSAQPSCGSACWGLDGTEAAMDTLLSTWWGCLPCQKCDSYYSTTTATNTTPQQPPIVSLSPAPTNGNCKTTDSKSDTHRRRNINHHQHSSSSSSSSKLPKPPRIERLLLESSLPHEHLNVQRTQSLTFLFERTKK